jgi:hypothetical protein
MPTHNIGFMTLAVSSQKNFHNGKITSHDCTLLIKQCINLGKHKSN